MSDGPNKQWRPYLEYLEKLRRQREEAGLPPAPDIAPQSYWEERRKKEALKDQLRRKVG